MIIIIIIVLLLLVGIGFIIALVKLTTHTVKAPKKFYDNHKLVANETEKEDCFMVNIKTKDIDKYNEAVTDYLSEGFEIITERSSTQDLQG